MVSPMMLNAMGLIGAAVGLVMVGWAMRGKYDEDQ